MIDFDVARVTLRDLGLGDRIPAIEQRVSERLAPGAHGDMPRWQEALRSLPRAAAGRAVLDQDAVSSGALGWTPQERAAAESALRSLAPWRKGPFEIDGILIDSEWRSNLKWNRVTPALTPLAGKRVLDVGCGNGYYALRMQGMGAAAVIGIDPTLLYVAQFQAISRFLNPQAVHVLPLRLDEFPAERVFDTTFSMGVLYHSRAPVDHLRQLRETLRPAGELVLETLVLPGDTALSRTPPERYARMRNVWHLPTVPELLTWLGRSGFRDARVIDTNVTATDEQRTTPWMTFDSLAAALDPADSSRTVEGWPRPCRSVVVARAPG